MTAPPAGIKPAPRAPWVHVFFWTAAIASALYLLACARGWDRALARSASFYEIRGAPPELAPNATRHFLDADALYWLAYARQAAESGAGRVRWTQWDNAPDGRPVHWSQPMIWLLAGAGKLRVHWTGESLPKAIETAALGVQPVLFAVFLVLSAWAIRRRWGLVPALFWLALVPASKMLFWSFHPFRPDHQALQILAAFGNLFFLTLGGLGWTRATDSAAQDSPGFRSGSAPSSGNARFAFAAAGLCAGIGLWLGATVSLLCTGAVLAAWAIMAFCFSPAAAPRDSDSFRPELWRLWGRAAAAASIAFYLLEYAPGPFAMRLEVNHPVYALAWLGMGELLAVLGDFRILGRPADRSMRIRLGLALALLAPLACAFAWGPDSWHALRHAGMRRLHLFISEFQSTPVFSRAFLQCWTDESMLVLLFLPLSAFLLNRGDVPRDERRSLGFAFFAALAFLLLASWQNRWSAFAAIFLLWTAVPALSALVRLASKSAARRVAFGALLALLAAQSGYAAAVHWKYLRKLRDGSAIQPLLTLAIQRDFAAQALARDPRLASARIVSSDPSLTPAIAYWARVSGLASFYWENVAGLDAATTFFTDSGDFDRARQIVRERGLTHLLISGPDKMAHDYAFILHGSYDETAIARSLGGRLRDRPDSPPVWLVPDPDYSWLSRVSFAFRGHPLPSDRIQLYRMDSDSP